MPKISLDVGWFKKSMIYMSMLENEWRRKCALHPNIKWLLKKRFIDDGFGIFEGTQEEVEYWINQFNLLIETIKIDKWSYGPHVEYMDLEIYRGSRLFEKGMFDIRLHQKTENNFLYFLIELLASIHVLVCIRYTWVNCRISNCKQLREWEAKKIR